MKNPMFEFYPKEEKINKFYAYWGDITNCEIHERKISPNSKYFDTLKEMLDEVTKSYCKNVIIKHSWTDYNINRDVFVVLADHSGYEKQFCAYFFED